mgnify:FL=1
MGFGAGLKGDQPVERRAHDPGQRERLYVGKYLPES